MTYISWRRDRCLATFGSLRINVERVLIDPLSFIILICISDLTLFTHSERVSKSFLFTLCPLSGIILDGIHKYFKVMFPVYGFRLTIFRPFGEHISQRGGVDKFKVTSLTWPVGLYMNGELAQVQSEGLDLSCSSHAYLLSLEFYYAL